MTPTASSKATPKKGSEVDKYPCLTVELVNGEGEVYLRHLSIQAVTTDRKGCHVLSANYQFLVTPESAELARKAMRGEQPK